MIPPFADCGCRRSGGLFSSRPGLDGPRSGVFRTRPVQRAFLHSESGRSAAGGDYWSGRPCFCSALFQVHGLPVSGVAAGPILALNVQNFSRRIAWTNGGSGALGPWRKSSLLAVLALRSPGRVYCTLLSANRRSRKSIDPGLEGWRSRSTTGDEHLLGADDRGFNLSADAANYSPGFALKRIISARHPRCFPQRRRPDFTAMRKQLSRRASRTMRRPPK